MGGKHIYLRLVFVPLEKIENSLFLKNFCGETSLKCWLKKLILNKCKRLSLIEKMSKKSILPKNVPWKILDLKVTGNNIY